MRIKRKEIALSRVLIVEPHDFVRNEIRKILSAHCPSVTVISDVGETKQAVGIAKCLRPDIITLEISLPDRAGFPLLRSLRDLLPGSHIIVVTIHDDRAYRDRAAREGASGFVSKMHLANQLPELLTSITLNDRSGP